MHIYIYIYICITVYQRIYVDIQLFFISTRVEIKKYKTFSVLIYSYINTSGNWKNEKLCGNTTPAGRSVFTQFLVFPISTRVDITVYQHGKWSVFTQFLVFPISTRVDITVYQHGKCFIFLL